MSKIEEKKGWTAEEIREKIRTDDRWATRALVALYKKQTIEEQEASETFRHNGVGFNGADANFLTRLAKWVIEKGYLTKKQLQCLRYTRAGKDRLGKYSRQLVRIAEEKQAARLEEVQEVKMNDCPVPR